MDLSLLGIPSQKINQLISANINTLEDLINYFPRKYHDFSTRKLISETKDGDICRVIGTITDIKMQQNRTTKITIKDESRAAMNIVWFKVEYPSKILKTGIQAVFAGTVSTGFWGKTMIAPLFNTDIGSFEGIYPVYKKVHGMSDEYLKKLIDKALHMVPKSEYVDLETIMKFKLMRQYEAARALHQPQTMENVIEARERIIFDDLFRFALMMVEEGNKSRVPSAIKIENANTVSPFIESLPFKLTDGENSQLSSVRSIFKKMRKGTASNSLIQGDVGCGKTMVAALLSLIVAENNGQTAILAPTSILAAQHYAEFCERFSGFGAVKPVLVTAGMKKKEREEILSGIERGDYNVIIGTHAILSESVNVPNLALTIVDEEHRFGVKQRIALQEKRESGVHNVSMSATPIPRSLALTIYGDNTDVYTIKQMPCGRLPIKTTIVNEPERCFDRIFQEVDKGHQAYVVCPIIEDSESERLEGVISVTQRAANIKKYAESLGRKIQVGVINGKMKQAEINEELDKFKDGAYNIIVSTTIVEVGVNVPNATMIVISNAERFGLAQLHQLRGRVGRSSLQSHCILLANKTDNERLNIMTITNDGFLVAKKDLELRGMGDFIGVSQSGDNKVVALMLLNEELYSKIKERAVEILSTPRLRKKYDGLMYLNE